MNRTTFVLIMALVAFLPALASAAASDSCCVGITGNVDGDPAEMVDIADVMALVSYLTTAEPIPSCPAESDANGDAVIDVLDILAVVDYLASGLQLPECPGTVADIDGNVYRTVTIGTQIWMAENLKVTHYRNGEAIPNITDGSTWGSLSTGAYCDYNNDVNIAVTYGRLYNWYAVADSLNIAPTGWHVSTDAEWLTLTNFLGGDAVAGGKMKEAGTTHWMSPNTAATNESGFSALPGGYRTSDYGAYYSMGSTANFWSSTEYGSYSWRRSLGYYGSDAYSKYDGKVFGFSVRCVKDSLPILTTSTVSAITQTAAHCGGTVTLQGIAAVSARGVCWSTNHAPTVSDSKTIDGSGTGPFASSISGLTANTIYYVRAYATSDVGTAYGNEVSFVTLYWYPQDPVTDIDGNEYRAVMIGTQVWMAENLKVTHYRNGDPIPNVTDSGSWAGLTTGAYCEYNDDVSNVATYGRLYNWYAVGDNRNIAPSGWHVPSDAEWQTLVDYLGGATVAAGKLRTGTDYKSGFAALYAGYRSVPNVGYGSMRSVAFFWSSTEYNSSYAYHRRLYAKVTRLGFFKTSGHSIRCLKD